MRGQSQISHPVARSIMPLVVEFLEIDLPPSNDKSLKILRPILFDRTNDYLPDRRVRETITRAADHTRCGSRLANVTRISESSPRLHRAAHSNGVSKLAAR